mgnify:CR=1 FL=1
MKKIDLTLINTRSYKKTEINEKDINKFFEHKEHNERIEEFRIIKLPDFESALNFDFFDVVSHDNKLFVSDYFTTIYYGSKNLKLDSFYLKLPIGFSGKEISLYKVYSSREDMFKDRYDIGIEYKREFLKNKKLQHSYWIPHLLVWFVKEHWSTVMKLKDPIDTYKGVYSVSYGQHSVETIGERIIKLNINKDYIIQMLIPTSWEFLHLAVFNEFNRKFFKDEFYYVPSLNALIAEIK